MAGPDLPPPTDPFTADVFEYRWPSGAEKVELLAGVLVFMGEFDERDAEVARRTYPGRTVFLTEDGAIEIHPAGQLRG